MDTSDVAGPRAQSFYHIPENDARGARLIFSAACELLAYLSEPAFLPRPFPMHLPTSRNI
jgi:hypothetical protein